MKTTLLQFFILISLGFFLSMHAPSSSAGGPCNNDIVLELNLDENQGDWAHDPHCENHFQLEGATQWVDSDCKKGSCVKLSKDETNPEDSGQLTHPNESEWDVPYYHKTIAMWVKLDPATEENAPFISKGSGSPRGFAWGLANGGKMIFRANLVSYYSKTVIPKNEWHHIAMAIADDPGTGNAEAAFFLDGVFDGWAQYRFPNQHNNGDLHIGGKAGNVYIHNYLTSHFDEIKLWNRRLSDSEICEDAGKYWSSGECIDTDLVFPMDVFANPSLGKLPHRIEPASGFGDYVHQFYDCDMNPWQSAIIPNPAKYHAGMDIISAVDGADCLHGTGNHPVYAIADGNVVLSGNDTGYPGGFIWIKLDHFQHQGKPIFAFYGHVTPTGIANGQVKTGEYIGNIFDNGQDSQYHAHLHFELRYADTLEELIDKSGLPSDRGYTTGHPLTQNNPSYLDPCRFIAQTGADVPVSCHVPLSVHTFNSQYQSLNDVDICVFPASIAGVTVCPHFNENYPQLLNSRPIARAYTQPAKNAVTLSALRDRANIDIRVLGAKSVKGGFLTADCTFSMPDHAQSIHLVLSETGPGSCVVFADP